MPRQFTCPQCRASLKIGAVADGTTMRCPKCQARFAVDGARLTELPDVVGAPVEEDVVTEEVIDEEVIDEEVIDEEVDERAERSTKKSRWKSCPRCGGRDPKKVKFTMWGSVLGPALFKHVRCRKCGYAYNGRSGRSNLVPIILFVSVPLAVIAGLVWWAVSILRERGVL